MLAGWIVRRVGPGGVGPAVRVPAWSSTEPKQTTRTATPRRPDSRPPKCVCVVLLLYNDVQSVPGMKIQKATGLCRVQSG